ncbi:MAG: hypothetical protein AAGB27_15850 [Pseudomonadota bacterium]
MLNRKKLIIGCALALACHSAAAVDGVIEISAVCVDLNEGCFAGDSAGLPVTITEPGSYRLTTNLSTSSTSVDIIEINADNVTLDLNGFTIQGPAECTISGGSTNCTSTGTGNAIDVNGDRVSIENGTIVGAAADGIMAAGSFSDLRVANLTVRGCGSDGILAAASGSIRDSVFAANGAVGINVGFGGTYVRDTVSYGNGDSGQFGGFCSNNVYYSNDASPEVFCNQVGTNLCGTTPC